MSPIIPSRKPTHQRLPSDDDLRKVNPGGSSTELLQPARWKGKGKATEHDLDGEQGSDIGDHVESSTSEQETEGDATELSTYPPTNEDEAESRRIEEVRSLTCTIHMLKKIHPQNLRRWEEAERQKRRAQRESRALSSPRPTSVVEGGWSALFSRSSTKRESTYNPHRPLRRDTTEDLAEGGYVMHRADSPTTPVPNTPGLSPATATSYMPSPPAGAAASSSENAGPFADNAGALMEPSSLPPTPGEQGPQSASTPTSSPPARPVLQAAQSTQLQIPSATRTQPPGTVPPRIVIPGEEPEASSSRRQQEPSSPHEPPSRWWTEWLCGCREDRHESQVRHLSSFSRT